ncbi:MAG: thiamine pyrophosphate-dependent dehydrogenase E1 component subunit alpha [Gammaproteobacteria bacterium]|nr:thiamine pyrophosphate-dependent dehydrogenase E1 component subunit alpha [Gammaproteobacteria bacterium]
MGRASRVAANVDEQRLLLHYRNMWRVRAFEQTALEALEQGLVPGPIHPSIGQEAVASGVCANLEGDDILLSTHRGHGHTLIKGAPPLAMMRELLGRHGGSCGGKGGSMHIADFSVGMLGANGVVGANILIAAGAAHAIKLKREPRVVACIFGDGAINRGPFLEGLNWAKIFALPVVFLCEDNDFAATTRTGSVSAGGGPCARAESLGIASVQVDGNDVLEVEAATRDALAAARAGDGPRFIHALTYRLSGHTAADAAAYRDSDEVAERWRADPIARAAEMLRQCGTRAELLADIEAEARSSMQAVLAEARDTPWPAAAHAHRDVQDTPGPGLPRAD